MVKFLGSCCAIGMFYLAFVCLTQQNPLAAVIVSISAFEILREIR